MFNFPLERERALQSPLIGVSFRVRLSRDFSRLSQIESLPCRLFFPLERPTSRFSLLHQEIKTKLLCWSTISEHIFTTLNNINKSLVLFWGLSKLWLQKAQASPVALFPYSLDKELYSTLSLFTQVYKWVPATYCWGATLRWTSIPSREE